MRQMRGVFFLAGAAVAAITGFGAVTQATSAVAVDGKLDERAWKDAQWERQFRRLAIHESMGAFSRPTEFAIVHDGRTLYVGVRCRETDFSRMTPPRDVGLWGCPDTVEFFFSPSGSRKSGYHVIVNSEGSIATLPWVAKGQSATEGKAWNPEIRTDIRKEKDRWTCEIAVPLSSIGPIAPSMPVNFCRSRILKTPGTYHQLFISSPLARKFWDSDGYAVIEL